MRDTDLDRRLRLMGVPVSYVAGWQTRGSSIFNPRGGGNHHTAGGRSGDAPSLNTVINGRPGLPGPLCNVLQSRSDVAILVAAGRANHGGQGGWKGVSGNSYFYGLEIEHVGTPAEPFGPHRFDTAARIQAAFALGRYDASWIWQHRQYATPKGRKIDFAASLINDGVFLSRIQHYIDHPPGLAPVIVLPAKLPKLTRTLKVGMKDGKTNPIIFHFENLLLWNAVKRGEPNRGPGKIDGKFTGEGGTAEALVYFRRWFYDMETLAGRTKAQRTFKTKEFPGVKQGDFSNVTAGLITLAALEWAAAI